MQRRYFVKLKRLGVMLVATGNLVAGTAGMELCDDLVGRNATHRHLFEGFRGNGWNTFPVADVGWGNATPFADAMKDRVVLVLERKQLLGENCQSVSGVCPSLRT